MAPAEDPMIAERKAEDLDAHIAKRIAHPVNPFPAWQSEPKTTTGVRVIPPLFG
jgi:hypothetical protein